MPFGLSVQTSDSATTWVGLEPKNDRDKRWAFLASLKQDIAQRFGFLVDTGAPESAVGQKYLNRYIEAYDLAELCEWTPYHSSLHGIGAGSAEVNFQCTAPIGLSEDLESCYLKSQVLEGCGENVPGLLGLASMFAHKAILDLRDSSRPTIEVDTHKGRRVLELQHVHGHLVLPIDKFQNTQKPIVKNKEEFLKDPLGLWYTSDDSEPVTASLASVASDPEFPQVCISLSENPVKQTSPVLSPVVPQSTKDPAPLVYIPVLLNPVSAKEKEDERVVSFHVPPLSSPGNFAVFPKTGTFAETLPNHRATSSSSTGLPASNLATCGSSNIRTVSSVPTNSTLPAPNYEIQKSLNHLVGSIRHVVNKARNTQKGMQLLQESATYKRKYQGMSKDTPVPEIPAKYLSIKQWDVWEWFSGCGKLSNACEALHLRTGPPISWETGWCFQIAAHREKLWELLCQFQPKVLFAAPVCGPWSIACTTMSPPLKEAIRIEQLQVFEFICRAQKYQTAQGRFWLYEQPRSSELLKTELAVSTADKCHAQDYILCMCEHNLTCPDTNLPMMKQTVLRGTVPLSYVVKWCSGHDGRGHTLMQGVLSSGQLRTAYAQSYTQVFCKRLARDIKLFVSNQCSAFPAEEDDAEGVLEDPYNVPEQSLSRVRERILQPKSKSATKKPDKRPATAEEAQRFRIEEALEDQQLEPFKPVETIQTLDLGLGVDGDGNPVPEMPAPLAVAKHKPLLKEAAEELSVLIDLSRIANGSLQVIQTGPRLRFFQSQFGDPSNKHVLAVVLCKRPRARPTPEPLLNRSNAPVFLELELKKNKWLVVQPGWCKYKQDRYSHKPEAIICLFGRDKEEWAQTLPEIAAEAIVEPQLSTPNILKVLQTGTREEKVALILSLHQRWFHKGEGDLTKLLSQAGAPLNTLPLVKEALKQRDTCRQWERTKAKPILKIPTALSFNSVLWIDLVFFSNVIIQVCVDEATRFCTLTIVDYKDETSLATGFRRGWVALFGPPRVVKCDKESAYTSDSFTLVLGKYNCELQSRVAKDAHSWMGILDRRVEILRSAYPKLVEELSSEYLIVDPADVVAELQFCVNSQLFYQNFSPYEVLFGTNPSPLHSDESEFLVDVPLFYEHQLIRAKAQAVFQQSLILAGVSRANNSRSRPSVNFPVGSWVDVWRKGKKGESGWRGPCVVCGVPTEGFVSVRWQSNYYDIPLQHVRLHYNAVPHSGLPTIEDTSEEPAAASSSVQAFVPSLEVDQNPPLEGASAGFVFYCEEAQSCYAIDDLAMPVELFTLASLASQLSPGTQLIHSVVGEGNITLHAKRDAGTVMRLGQRVATVLNVRIIVAPCSAVVGSRQELLLIAINNMFSGGIQINRLRSTVPVQTRT